MKFNVTAEALAEFSTIFRTDAAMRQFRQAIRAIEAAFEEEEAALSPSSKRLFEAAGVLSVAADLTLDLANRRQEQERAKIPGSCRARSRRISRPKSSTLQ